MNLKQLITFGLEESQEPVIKNPILREALVGTPTKEVTQYGRRIYNTPGGEQVSEKSTTFFLNGKWLNVPSIHNGRAFTDDQLRRMIKEGKIQPTSVHGSRTKAEEAAGQRSDMMKRHERGFKPGGLVEPGVTHYARKSPTKINEELFTKIDDLIAEAGRAGQVLGKKGLGEGLGYKVVEKGKTSGQGGLNKIIKAWEKARDKTFTFKPSKFTKDSPKVKQVIELFENGMSKKTIEYKTGISRKEIRSIFHQFAKAYIGDENHPTGEGKWAVQKRRKKIIKELTDYWKDKPGGKEMLEEMKQKLKSIKDKNREIANMSDEAILNNKMFKEAMGLDVKGLKAGEGINFNRYKNLTDADYIAKIRAMAETNQFYQPEHLIPINKKNPASMRPKNIYTATGKMGGQLETLKSYVINNPKGDYVSQIDELFTSQGLPTSEANYKKLWEEKGGKIFKDAGIPCLKGAGGTCTTPKDFRKGFNQLVKEAADGKGSKAAISKLANFTKKMRGLKGAATWTGYGLLAEAGFMVPFAVGDYAAGKSWKRILGNATDYGFGPIFGQSEQEEFEAALPEGSKAVGGEKVLELGERLTGMEEQKVNPGYGRVGFKEKAPEQRQKVYTDILDEYDLNFQPFLSDTPYAQDQWHQGMWNQAHQDAAEARAQIAKENLEREQKRNIALEEEDYYGAEGGIASLNVKK